MGDPLSQENRGRNGSGGRVAEYRVIAPECEIEVTPPAALIIFGASGDLAKRKLFPSLYRLYKHQMLADNFLILGTSRVEYSTGSFRAIVQDAVREAFPADFDQAVWDGFQAHVYYSTFDYGDLRSYTADLVNILPALEQKHQTRGNRIFYLAIPPQVFEAVINNLGRAGLSRQDAGCSHVVIEKPFGHDLASARKLNQLVHTYFKESQIFRIDHYLAKETVQNILMFRFANAIFEPLWNQRYLDHIQITAAETLGVEHRAGYYEQAGIIRDMFQNHMYQLLCLTAMEPPSRFIAEQVHDEKAKVLRSLRRAPREQLLEQVVIGQYGPGRFNGRAVPGYREEEGVSRDSRTPTFAAMKLFVDNWRWHGVPFYLRSGKRLAARKTEISIHFRDVPFSMFPDSVTGPIAANTIVLMIQPDEGMSLTFQSKQPGTKVCLSPVQMTYSYPRGVLLDAYEWVLLDCMLGDHMLFMREDSVELAWSTLMPLLDAIASDTRAAIPVYPAGSDGPDEARRMIEGDGRFWRPL
ncbi:MAG TPA: glucose-6-phosphate dehydrogenase [Nitrospirota bacterium]|nr:glucose-6-phosphate dehydrogenase [Nitrospirota bacterium]